MIFDFIWKSLFLTATLATFFLAAALLIQQGLKKYSAQQLKWYLNSQLLLLATVLVGAFLWSVADRDLSQRCFEVFVQQSAGWTITRWLGEIWLAGFAVLVVGDLVRSFVTWKRVRAFPPVEDIEVLAQFARLKARFGVQAALLQSSEVMSPFAFGIFRAKIVMPAHPMSPATRRSALAHELAHVRDRDALWRLVELFCRRVLFWHPLAYALARNYSACVETAADEAAVERAQIPRAEFLNALVDIATFARGPVLSPLTLNASRGFTEIKSRMEALARGRRGDSSWRLAMLSALAVLPVLVSMAEARVTQKIEPYDPKMCVQVTHEKMIESWLRIEPAAPPRCGK